MNPRKRPLKGLKKSPSLAFMLGLGALLSPSLSHAQPQAKLCAELMPLYKESLTQYQEAQQAYLKAGCNEQSEEALCKRLALSGRELMSALQMLSARLQAASCDPTQPAQPMSECERTQRLLSKTEAKLTELERQRGAQRCEARPHAPPCRALKEQRAQQLKLLRATEQLKAKQGCGEP